MGGHRRIPIAALAVALLAAACSQTPAPPGGAGSTPPPFTAATVDATIDRLARAGIAVVDEPGGEPIAPPAAPVAPIQLLRWQVHSLALEEWAHAGSTGAELDAVDPRIVDGAPPISAWLAAYVQGVRTPGADFARELVGDQDLHEPASVRFPLLVGVLFAGDMAARLGDGSGEATAFVAPGGVGLAGGAVLGAPPGAVLAADPCGALGGFISSTVDGILRAVQIPPAKVGDTGSSLLNDVLQAGADLIVGFLNWAIGTGETILVGGVEVVLKKVLDPIAEVVGILAVISEIVSAVRPWTVRVTPDEAVTRKGIVDGEVVTDRVQASVDLGGFVEWPKEIASCASLAGAPLPDLRPTGAPVTWLVVSAPPDLATIERSDTRLRAAPTGGVADLVLRTSQETRDQAIRGKPRQGTVRVSATIRRTQLEDAQRSILAVIDRQLSLLPEVVRGQVLGFISGQLSDFVARIGTLVDVGSTTEVTVNFHGEPEEETPSPESGLSGTWAGTWVSSVGQRDGTFQVRLVQSGERLTGSITISRACVTQGSVNGSLKGHTVTFGVVQGRYTISYEGSVSGNSMHGSWDAPACDGDQGTWRAHRAG